MASAKPIWARLIHPGCVFLLIALLCESLSTWASCLRPLRNDKFFFGGGPDQGELAYPAHHMALETTSRNQRAVWCYDLRANDCGSRSDTL